MAQDVPERKKGSRLCPTICAGIGDAAGFKEGRRGLGVTDQVVQDPAVFRLGLPHYRKRQVNAESYMVAVDPGNGMPFS